MGAWHSPTRVEREPIWHTFEQTGKTLEVHALYVAVGQITMQDGLCTPGDHLSYCLVTQSVHTSRCYEHKIPIMIDNRFSDGTSNIKCAPIS